MKSTTGVEMPKSMSRWAACRGRTFHSWQAAAKQRHFLRHCSRSIWQRSAQTRRSQCWAAWTSRCHSKQRQRALMSASLRAMRQRNLHRAFTTWSDRTLMLSGLRIRLQTFAATQRQRILWCCFHSCRQVLQRVARNKADGQRATEFWRCRRAAAAFATWRGHAVHSTTLRSLADGAMRKWRMKTESAAFTGWRAMVARHQRHRQLLQPVISRLQHSLLAAAVAGWRERAAGLQQKHVLLTRCVRSMVLHRQRVAFATWQDLKDRRVQTKVQTARAVGRIQHIREVSPPAFANVKQLAAGTGIVQTCMSAAGNVLAQLAGVGGRQAGQTRAQTASRGQLEVPRTAFSSAAMEAAPPAYCRPAGQACKSRRMDDAPSAGNRPTESSVPLVAVWGAHTYCWATGTMLAGMADLAGPQAQRDCSRTVCRPTVAVPDRAHSI